MSVTIAELNQHFNVEELVDQLESAVITQDPLGYMESNINWEIDRDLEDSDDDLDINKLASVLFSESAVNKNYARFNPFRGFSRWFRRNRTVRKVKKILCSISDKIKELIDEEAELKKILEVALVAIATAIGIGAINPLVLTILVGFLATMILTGVSNVCGA